MKKQLQELKQEFLNFSTSQNEYVVNDKKYNVVSHFVGNKNINEILNLHYSLVLYVFVLLY